ncbi:restriction endonuclease subunit S [Flavobacterium sp. LC2016-12]|uniref:restriction endonuclease subunit S n=1 Tax=Flavobacterium sp. LC2016-12 TaxID=2783794 RepID=UPI00188AA416|nr:restriction endonuclease subunit S [Flavobacterium sp. LC2016-12]MBF4466227.1 restriction endonuclease subunit S [Flavobacterium sp. LC2016-12]
MSANSNTTKWVRLGDYIQRSMANNNNLEYGIELIEGVNNKGEFCAPKSALKGINLKPYKIVQNGDFVYNPSRLNIGSLAYRQKGMCIVSHLYVVFRLNDIGKKLFIPEFLYLFFNRNDFLRLVTYLNFGSQRPEFNFYDMSEIQIPLPDINIQQELVDTYNGLKALAEQNEVLIKPLSEACQAYMVDCKKKYPEVELGEYIDEYDKRNSDKKIKAVKSVSVTKEFKETNAKVNKDELGGYKLVPPNHLSYVQTTKNEKCFANALNTTNETYVVTQVNRVIRSKDESVLNIGFLHLIFRGVEFDRYAIFNSWGSARETFDWSELRRVRIPLPPPEVQQAIVNIYNCAEEAKNIAKEAREKIKTLCPALVQRAING